MRRLFCVFRFDNSVAKVGGETNGDVVLENLLVCDGGKTNGDVVLENLLVCDGGKNQWGCCIGEFIGM